MLREVESLITHEKGARDFLETPAFALGNEPAGGEDHGELEPGDTIGDCTVLRLLGEGGMGEVYLAQDTRLERQVAVKLLKRHLGDETLLRRFHHERKVLAGLTHPNIARLYGGAVTPDGRPYLVMEYVHGERLDRYCGERAPALPERLALFRKVCSAVTYAHQNLVIHRDLKPANLRVTAEGEPKLLDFGIAKLVDLDTARNADVTLTMFGALTPEYASPEQLKGDAITTASDVYSLGVILYELITGQRPYAGSFHRSDELARAICEQEPARPSAVADRSRGLRRQIEGDLDNIVAMALRKEPARRYASVAQLSEDIRRHCDGLPVIARRDTLGYRAGKFVRRHKAGVAAAAFIVLALVGGLAAATWQARVARQERDHARAAQAQAELAQEQAERLNTFLQTLLGSPDPAKMGKDVKVVEVLDAVSRNLDRELADQPEILAQAHQTISRAYTDLQILQSAEQHARAALSIARRLHGACANFTRRGTGPRRPSVLPARSDTPGLISFPSRQLAEPSSGSSA